MALNLNLRVSARAHVQLSYRHNNISLKTRKKPCFASHTSEAQVQQEALAFKSTGRARVLA